MRTIIAFIGIVCIAFAIGTSWFVQSAWFSVEQAGEPIRITVEENETYDDVKRKLVASNVISSGLLYDVYAQFDRNAVTPKVGEYSFRKGASLQAIAGKLASGPKREEVRIRMVEGESIDQNTDRVSEYGISSNIYWGIVGRSLNRQAFQRTLAEEFSILEDLPEGHSLEGYLFPDTYHVWEDEMPEGLVRKQLRTLLDRVVIPYEEKRKASGLSWHEVLTLASIVEDEVRQPETRKIVAGIFLNRLRNDMRLQSDATINYIVNEGRDRATTKDLEVDSPYNTYRNGGLPIGPIGNPSLSSIIAVLEPTETDYLYFLTDAQGKIYYGKSFEDHQKNRQEAYGE